ncbi:helix-turn-helix domain-containing protein [Lacrimispora sp.]|uniref:helix-turn-helix domain-containing protein n=1 Tax=Lacrimispora sp. TaxID=2719234 RepID=UPI0039969F9B
MQLAEAKNIETFSENIDDLLESTLNEIRENIMNDPSISSANKNKEIIIALEQRGIFNIKDSVVKIANLLNISKNTVYLHLRNLK